MESLDLLRNTGVLRGVFSYYVVHVMAATFLEAPHFR